jgi:hypothetical protein
MGQTARIRNTKTEGGTPSGTDIFNQVCTVRIELLDTDPLIWRQVEVPTSITLKVLHDIIQITMGWLDYHLWEFKIAKQRFGPPMEADPWGTDPPMEATKVRLRDMLNPRKTRIDYLYDFGDSWEHRLTVTDFRQGEPGVSYPRYIGGEWAAPPEDCGGIQGFYDKLDVMADPEHPEHAEIMEWLGDYDPKRIDERSIKTALGRIAR